MFYLSPIHHILESVVFSEGHIEFFELCGEFHSYIPPVPWFNLIFIDVFSFLITLCPSIQMSVSLEPFDVGDVFWIFIILFLSSCIKEIHCESELMLRMSWWCTETISTLSKIPHPFLIGGTSIGGYHDDGFSESDMEIMSHIPERFSYHFPDFIHSSGFADFWYTSNRNKISGFIVFITQTNTLAYKGIDLDILIFKTSFPILDNRTSFFDGFLFLSFLF